MLKESEHFSDTFKESVKPNEIIEIIDITIDDDDEDGIIQVRRNDQSSIEMMSHKGILAYFSLYIKKLKKATKIKAKLKLKKSKK